MLHHWRTAALAATAVAGLFVSVALAADVVLQIGDKTIVGRDGKFRLRDGTYLLIDPRTGFASHLRGGKATPANGTYVLPDGRSIPAAFGNIQGPAIVRTR